MMIDATTRSPNGPRRVGRPAGPTERGATTRAGLIRTAATVFARKGYERATMADIVAASELTKGAVYFHFPGKEALAIAVLEAKQDEWVEEIRSSLASVPEGAPRLRALLPAMLELHKRDPDAWVVSRLSVTLSELASTRGLAAQLTRRWVDSVRELVEAARQEPGRGAVAADIDSTVLATVLVGAFDGIKSTAEVLSEGDRDRAQQSLSASAGLLERIVFNAMLGDDESTRPTASPENQRE